MSGHIDPPFYNSLSPYIDPYFVLFSPSDPQIIHNQFSAISHWMTHFFDNIWMTTFSDISSFEDFFFKYFKIFAENVSKFVFYLKTWPKICQILTFWPLFLGLLSEWPPFWRKITHPKTSIFELLSEHPLNTVSTFNQWKETCTMARFSIFFWCVFEKVYGPLWCEFA